MTSVERSEERDDDSVVDLAPLVRRVVASRIDDAHLVDDVVQETLTRLIAIRDRLDDEALAPYAVVIARNLVRTLWRQRFRDARHAHRITEITAPYRPDEEVLRQEEADAVTRALSRLTPRDQEGLLAHEVDGRRTAALAREWGSTSGAVGQQLHRARARLRVEYVIEVTPHVPPLTPTCRPVLFAFSAGDRRRQRELDAGHHLLACDACALLSAELFATRRSDDIVTVRIERDADVVAARQRASEIAQKAGFSPAEATMIATAVSEIARNIVQFAHRGEIEISVVENDQRCGATIVARDAGPGINDVAAALTDGTSSYGGLGLGLPGSRRLMDDFEVSSEVGRGTTVRMTKWRQL